MAKALMELGVCYYPEHWPEERWALDARAMVELGLSHVRIGEFAWSRLEPDPGRYDWAWLDRAIDSLGQAGLKIILGTPTATPPKHLLDRFPDMLARDEFGRIRGFGSRRHYCFSSKAYREQAAIIVEALARRYGRHEAIAAWQTDNEYGCHDTILSYSDNALHAFRDWLRQRYPTIHALNEAWGNVFWSMEYRDFQEIELPCLAVTELNPAHKMAFQRFSSDQVRIFNRAQVDILRQYSPGRWITHNFMGWFNAFDHHDVGADIDMASWDSYPLGFLDLSDRSAQEKKDWLRQGDPDFAGFHHDLYRGCASRLGVMELQPGPVNWARHNPAPLPGMVRLWALEAFAHGADLVSFFRWRQAPFAQEQMHAGLLRPDAQPSPAFAEVAQLAKERERLDQAASQPAKIALLYDYSNAWMTRIQPQGASFSYDRLVLDFYSALRRLGHDIDVIGPNAELEGYQLIVAPGAQLLHDDWVERAQKSGAILLLGPRTGAKTAEFQIPENLAPGPVQACVPIRVIAVESLPADHCEPVAVDGRTFHAHLWRERVEGSAQIRAAFADGWPFWLAEGRCHYLTGWPAADLCDKILAALCDAAQIARPNGQALLPVGLRLRSRGRLQYAFHYGPEPCDLRAFGGPEADREYVLGQAMLKAGELACWAIEGR